MKKTALALVGLGTTLATLASPLTAQAATVPADPNAQTTNSFVWYYNGQIITNDQGIVPFGSISNNGCPAGTHVEWALVDTTKGLFNYVDTNDTTQSGRPFSEVAPLIGNGSLDRADHLYFTFHDTNLQPLPETALGKGVNPPAGTILAEGDCIVDGYTIVPGPFDGGKDNVIIEPQTIQVKRSRYTVGRPAVTRVQKYDTFADYQVDTTTVKGTSTNPRIAKQQALLAAKTLAAIDNDSKWLYREDVKWDKISGRVYSAPLWPVTTHQFVRVWGSEIAKYGSVDKAIAAKTGKKINGPITTATVGQTYTQAWKLGAGASPAKPWGAGNTIAQTLSSKAPAPTVRYTTIVVKPAVPSTSYTEVKTIPWDQRNTYVAQGWFIVPGSEVTPPAPVAAPPPVY